MKAGSRLILASYITVLCEECLIYFFQQVMCFLFSNQFLVVGTIGSPTGNRKSGRSSAFSLFNLKEKSRFWSESVLLGGSMFCIV